MAKLNTYPTWKQDAVVYWEAEIDTEVEAKQSTLGYSDTEKEQMRTDLKAEMNTFMNAYDPKYNSYSNDNSKEDEFTGILLSIGTYIMGKDIAATPAAPVKPLSTLPGDDLRNLFALWLENLPDFTTLFTIYIANESTDPEDPMAPEVLVYEVQKNASYDTLLTDFDTFNDDDLGRMDGIVEESGNAQRNRAAYLLFAGADAVIVRAEVDLNTKLLVDYHAQEVLDTFGWTVVGLND